MSKEKKVCVVVVTYNRKEYLLKLIESLMNQTYAISKILIFDNNSNDGTNNLLKEKGYIDFYDKNKIIRKNIDDIEICYYRNDNNSGGSGGFNKGIELAHSLNCDYIWTMDDDVLPDKNCLENLIKYLSPSRRMCIPNRTDEKFKDYAIIDINMNNPFKYNVKKMKKNIIAEVLKENVIDVKDMPFEGPIFYDNLVDEIGLPNKDLFILFDDTEYAYRAQKVTNIGFVKNAVLHKQIIPKKEKNKLMNWKNYYFYRNLYWFNKTYGKNILVKILRPFLNHLRLITKCILERKWSDFKIINQAYYDGTHNILGKTVEPGKEFKKIK